MTDIAYPDQFDGWLEDFRPQPTLQQLLDKVLVRCHLDDRFTRQPRLLLNLALKEQGLNGRSPAENIEFFARRAPEGEQLRGHISDAIIGDKELGYLSWHAVLIAVGVPEPIVQYVTHHRAQLVMGTWD